MRGERGEYPPRKAAMYRDARELPARHRAVALVRMDKVRASQILPLRKRLGSDVRFFSVKGKLVRKALEGVDVPGLPELASRIAGQCMLLFTDSSPFRLSAALARSKVMMPARPGDVASVDVVVPARNTGVAPGPMLTDFKEAGIPTKIDQGTIWITKDTVPVRRGEPIGGKLAGLLTKLDIKPVEAGISLYCALEGGTVYSEDDLAVDPAALEAELAAAHAGAVSLAVEAGHVSPETAPAILARAASHARSLSAESGFVTEETRSAVLQRAAARAAALAAAAKYEAS